MTVGQSIRARGPKGNFTYTPNMVRRLGMIAGGTGITPMLQIIDAIVRGRESGDQTEIDLIYANVTVEDILQKVILDKHAEDPGIRVHYVLDRPPEGWDGGIGYVTADMITVCLQKIFVDFVADHSSDGSLDLHRISRFFSAGLLPW